MNRLLSTLAFSLVGVIALCSQPAAAQAAAPAPAKSVAARVQPFVDRHDLAGAVMLVASRDKILTLEAIGQADIAREKPMRPDSLVWIASISKPITATALLMLVDEGKVRLDDPVEKYLPEFKGQMLAVETDREHVLLKPPARPITVRDILSHTSGLPFMSRAEHKIDTYPLSVAAMSYAMSPLMFQPGTKSQYANAGLNTAGRIIEVVSSLPYEEFLQQRLFGPLGMKDTTFWPNEEQLGRLATSYQPNAAGTGLEETTISQVTYPLTNRRRGPSPAGGLFSTATDLSLFARMILSGGVYEGRRYLSAAALREMTSTQPGTQAKGAKGEIG